MKQWSSEKKAGTETGHYKPRDDVDTVLDIKSVVDIRGRMVVGV